MTPRILTDAEYRYLKEKLHQAHDKLIKLTLEEKGAMQELTEIVIMPSLEGVIIDLDSLKLDTTTYIRQNLKAFYSDIVYRATLTDENKENPQPANVALLIEHKSEMPKQLAVRLQAFDYISAIMKKHYNKDTDKTIPVIAIIFNQFDKDWQPKSFRSLFPELSDKVNRLIPEFDLLDKYGTLRATLLAMKNVRNKRFLKKHIEEIFVFLQQHPEKTDFRDQLITYLLGQSDLSGEELEELISNIFSKTLKEEIMISGTGFLAVAAREAAATATAAATAAAQKKAERAAKKAKLAIEAAKQEAKQEVEKTKQEAKQEAQLQTRLTVMRSWNKGSSTDFIVDIVDMPHGEVSKLITVFENIKTDCYSKTNVDINELVQSSGLTEFEVKTLLMLLQK
jgi:predicted transposase/invertase (TIGR01784 family)